MTLLLAGLLLSQNFDAASVRLGPPANTGRFTMTGGPGTNDPTFLRYSNVPLKRVLMIAYDVKYWQIAGPDWLNTQRFDITARLPEGTTRDQSLAMMRNLLTERFQMAVHRETKELPIYALLKDKTGTKLKASTDEAGDVNAIATVKKDEGKDGFPVLTPGAPGIVVETRNGRARISGFHSDLSKLADFLSTQLGRPVLDQTEIGGTFDFAVYYRPENAAVEDTNPYPEIFGALREQLGLRLEARKGPVEMLVIDRIEKVPSGN
ncbi:MAG TPA: TIGR03435 family protein [Bryobacteraceae bacterium]|jgi:uncharacterized protein (TIGR03435 family)|nr:TIGR03435 family protein [Bryobacteraceae bacterium]